MSRPHEQQWASLHQRVLSDWNNLDEEMLDVLSNRRIARDQRAHGLRDRSRRSRDSEPSDLDN